MDAKKPVKDWIDEPEVLTLDVRPLLPSQRHPVIFAILDKLNAIGAPEALRVVSDHKPVGLPMEMNMIEKYKGKYHLSFKQEGRVWLIYIKRKEEAN